MQTLRAGIVVAAALAATALGIRPATAAPPPIDAASDHVHCSSIIGTIQISPPFTGSSSTVTKFTIRETLLGCVDTDNSSVELMSGTATGTLKTSAPVSLSDLVFGSATPVTGTIKIAWKTVSGAAKLVSPTTTLTVTSLDGGQALSPESEGLPVFGNTLGDVFLALTIGSPDIIGSTGSFTGGDGGINSTIIGVMSQSIEALEIEAVTTGKIGGAKIGIGAAQLG